MSSEVDSSDLTEVIGALVVSAPIAGDLFLDGHPRRALVLVAYGVLVITSLADYVLRPRAVGGASRGPPLLTFISLLGGIELFGLPGPIVAPIGMSVLVAAFRIHDREVRAGSAPGAEPAPLVVCRALGRSPSPQLARPASFGARALLFALAFSSSACALTSKGSALPVRWFDPETATRTTTSAPGAAVAPAQPFAVELGRVTSGAHIQEKIAYREAAFEVGFYDDKRWTERPEVYVRRALARTLFDEHGVQRALAGQAPALEVEVLSFEEVRGRSPTARIQLRIMLHDHRTALLEQTITVDRAAPPHDERFDAFVHAMAQALDAAAEQVASEVERALRGRAEQPAHE